MTLKEEIDKLIRTEKGLLEQQDADRVSENKKFERSFVPLKSALAEFIESVDPKYLKSLLGDDKAILEVGLRSEDSFQRDIYWHVIPNNRIKSLDQIRDSTVEFSGFIVEEMFYDSSSRFPSSRHHLFTNTQEVVSHIVEHAAKKLAQYKHR
jgi:hypothetical protein